MFKLSSSDLKKLPDHFPANALVPPGLSLLLIHQILHWISACLGLHLRRCVEFCPSLFCSSLDCRTLKLKPGACIERLGWLPCFLTSQLRLESYKRGRAARQNSRLCLLKCCSFYGCDLKWRLESLRFGTLYGEMAPETEHLNMHENMESVLMKETTRAAASTRLLCFFLNTLPKQLT